MFVKNVQHALTHFVSTGSTINITKIRIGLGETDQVHCRLVFYLLSFESNGIYRRRLEADECLKLPESQKKYYPLFPSMNIAVRQSSILVSTEELESIVIGWRMYGYVVASVGSAVCVFQTAMWPSRWLMDSKRQMIMMLMGKIDEIFR